MPFNHLLFKSLLPGKTLAEDKRSGCRTSADLERGRNETVLLFRLDEASTRKLLGLSDQKCCDHLYFLKSEKNTTLIFVELKSTDLDQAEKQILSSYRAICNHSNVKSQSPRTLALIVSAIGTPPGSKKRQLEMSKRGIDLYFGTSRGRPCSIKSVIRDLS
jgi:hypothetical protein